MAAISLALPSLPSTQFPISSFAHKNLLPAKRSRRMLKVMVTKASTNPNSGNNPSTARRSANYHPNLWDDDFILSLPRAYESPLYAEQAERMIKEVKEEVFNGMAPIHSSLLQRLTMVDTIERLGIDRHFQKEIKETLDHVYRCWKERIFSSGKDANMNTIALAFRILRLHRYNVSSDVLKDFKEKDGNFLSSYTQSQEEIRSVLNLFRASLIAFPEEKVMDEVKVFTNAYLKKVMPNIDDANLLQEIIFNLDYGWHTNIPRLEARNYIDIYGENTSWITCITNRKILDLAKLDFNMMQSMQQRELQKLSRWLIDSKLPQLDFARNRYVEFYFWALGGCIEPKNSTFRIGFSKMCVLATIMDDIYDTYGTLDELKMFTYMVKRWDTSTMNTLPKYMQVVFKAFYEMMNEITQEVAKAQGQDTIDYARKVWEMFVDSLMQEAEWLSIGHIPTFEEYLGNGKISAGGIIFNLQPLLTMDTLLPKMISPKIGFPSKLNEILAVILRLTNDINSFKVEAKRGEEASCVRCYMRDNPRSTEEEALAHLKNLREILLKELTWEYLKPNNIPTSTKDHTISILRGFNLLYRERDGFTISTKDTRSHIMKILVQHVPM